MKLDHYIIPSWASPANVFAFSTTCLNGYSKNPYASFNLADHVGDNENDVASNRFLLKQELALPAEPIWLKQIHSNKVININNQNGIIQADASFADKPNKVCVILTADCLPILICDKTGTTVAAVHAGWRGILHGIIENTINALSIKKESTLVWLGPAIGPTAFFVGDDVYQAFLAKDKLLKASFQTINDHKWLLDIYHLTTQIFEKLGIINVYCEQFCTYNDKQNFFSYRRDLGKTGRMASLIWFT